MKELEIYLNNLFAQNNADDEFSALLNETALSGNSIPNLTFKTIDKNQKHLEKVYRNNISFDQAVLFTNVFNNEMPDEEDDLEDLIFDLKKKAEIHSFDTETYKSNYYYKMIAPLLKKYKNKEENFGEIHFAIDYYDAYNLFLADEIHLDSHLHEITPLGYFNDDFYYPLVSTKDTVWMSIIPHEINTMEKPLNNAEGKVLVYGLGLGYFPLMCAKKDNVEKVVIIENNQDVISLFNKIILPCFPKSITSKISIIKDDVFNVAKNIDKKQFDYVFADIWHNEVDGLFLYKELLNLEKENIKYDYWIEETILVYLKKILVFIIDISQKNRYILNYRELDDEYKKLCDTFKPVLDSVKFETVEDYKKFFIKDNLKSLLKN